MPRHWLFGWVVLAILSLFTAGAMAQEAQQSISVSGQASLPLRPEILRLTLQVSAQGSDIHEALAKLKAQRDNDKSKLLAAGADADTLKFSDPGVGTDANLTPPQRAMQQMMMNRGGAPASTQPSGVTVSCELTAEWPLSPGSPDDALAAATDLQTKIKAAIPTGAAPAAQTPEEQEIAEEMAAQQNNQPSAKPDEPHFTFVHRLSDDERIKVLSSAFADAAAQAQRLAHAAGRQVGALSRLSTIPADATNPESAYIDAMTEASTGSPPAEPNDSEVTSDQESNVVDRVSLTATFVLN